MNNPTPMAPPREIISICPAVIERDNSGAPDDLLLITNLRIFFPHNHELYCNLESFANLIQTKKRFRTKIVRNLLYHKRKLLVFNFFTGLFTQVVE